MRLIFTYRAVILGVPMPNELRLRYEASSLVEKLITCPVCGAVTSSTLWDMWNLDMFDWAGYPHSLSRRSFYDRCKEDANLLHEGRKFIADEISKGLLHRRNNDVEVHSILSNLTINPRDGEHYESFNYRCPACLVVSSPDSDDATETTGVEKIFSPLLALHWIVGTHNVPTLLSLMPSIRFELVNVITEDRYSSNEDNTFFPLDLITPINNQNVNDLLDTFNPTEMLSLTSVDQQMDYILSRLQGVLYVSMEERKKLFKLYFNEFVNESKEYSEEEVEDYVKQSYTRSLTRTV